MLDKNRLKYPGGGGGGTPYDGLYRELGYLFQASSI